MNVVQFVCKVHGVVVEFDAPGPTVEPKRCLLRRCGLPLERREVEARGPTLNRPASIAAGIEGAARAEAHADPDWNAEADAAIERTARALPRLHSDDVWETGGLRRTRENRALGPRLTAAARRGIIAPTDTYVRTAQVKSHGSPSRVWQSLIYEEATP